MGSRDRLDGVEIGRQAGAGGFRVVRDCSFFFLPPCPARPCSRRSPQRRSRLEVKDVRRTEHALSTSQSERMT
jgi:hypothetical protein